MAIHTREQLSVRVAGQFRQQDAAQLRLAAAHRAGKHDSAPAVKCATCRKYSG